MNAQPPPSILALLQSKRAALSAAVPRTLAGAMAWASIVQAVGLSIARDDARARDKHAKDKKGGEFCGGPLRNSDPQTIYTSVLYFCRLGLDMSGNTGQAFLVPFWNKHRRTYECQPITGQQGIVELLGRTGLYEAMVTGVIHRHDDYDFDAARRYLRHKYDPEADRGPAVMAYCRLWLKGAPVEWPSFQELMPQSEMHKIRKMAPNSPAWSNWADEMWRRSALKRCAKRAPKSADLSRVLTSESELEARQARGDVIDATEVEPPLIAEDPIDLEEARPKAREREPVRTADSVKDHAAEHMRGTDETDGRPNPPSTGGMP